MSRDTRPYQWGLVETCCHRNGAKRGQLDTPWSHVARWRWVRKWGNACRGHSSIRKTPPSAWRDRPHRCGRCCRRHRHRWRRRCTWRPCRLRGRWSFCNKSRPVCVTTVATVWFPAENGSCFCINAVVGEMNICIPLCTWGAGGAIVSLTDLQDIFRTFPQFQ